MKNYKAIDQLILLLILCSLALIILVLYFEYVIGLNPCKLCLWQRVPHVMTILIGVLALLNNQFKSKGAIICALMMLAGSLLSGYHAGIEYNLWPGPSNCSGTTALNTNNAELFLETILATPITRCDEIVWSFLNISMAGWNFISSIALMTTWLLVSKKTNATQ